MIWIGNRKSDYWPRSIFICFLLLNQRLSVFLIFRQITTAPRNMYVVTDLSACLQLLWAQLTLKHLTSLPSWCQLIFNFIEDVLHINRVGIFKKCFSLAETGARYLQGNFPGLDKGPPEPQKTQLFLQAEQDHAMWQQDGLMWDVISWFHFTFSFLHSLHVLTTCLSARHSPLTSQTPPCGQMSHSARHRCVLTGCSLHGNPPSPVWPTCRCKQPPASSQMGWTPPGWHPATQHPQWPLQTQASLCPTGWRHQRSHRRPRHYQPGWRRRGCKDASVHGWWWCRRPAWRPTVQGFCQLSRREGGWRRAGSKRCWRRWCGDAAWGDKAGFSGPTAWLFCRQNRKQGSGRRSGRSTPRWPGSDRTVSTHSSHERNPRAAPARGTTQESTTGQEDRGNSQVLCSVTCLCVVAAVSW